MAHPYLKTLSILRANIDAGKVDAALAVQLLVEERAGKARIGAIELLDDLAVEPVVAEAEAKAKEDPTVVEELANELADVVTRAALAADAADDHDPLELVEPAAGEIAPKHIRLLKSCDLLVPNTGRGGATSWRTRGIYRGELAAHIYGLVPELCEILD